MRPAELQLQRDIAQLQFSNPVYPLVNNVDAAEVTSDTIVASSLVRQVCSPVRWAESMQLLIRQGVEFFVEVGPGRVLSGLLRQIDRNAKLTNVGDEKSLNETLTLLSQSA
jgi:[acyl-carrier-protein] S-malonyltransferase